MNYIVSSPNLLLFFYILNIKVFLILHNIISNYRCCWPTLVLFIFIYTFITKDIYYKIFRYLLKLDYICYRQSIYLGTHISGSALIEESKNLKLNDNKIQSYNLENDYLFGKPLNSKWENDQK